MQISINPENLTLFAIVLNKVQNLDLTKEAIDRHVKHLRALNDEDRLVLCGPFSDHPSGMVVIKAKDKKEAVDIAQRDPFVKEGFRTFEIRTWLLACEENNYLSLTEADAKT